MSESNLTAFLNKYHIHLVAIIIGAIVFVLVFSSFYDSIEVNSKLQAWFAKPLSSADLGDVFWLVFIHAWISRA